ncbi:uncharacterized protein V6R79_014205 [Siganus canaliculatus]
MSPPHTVGITVWTPRCLRTARWGYASEAEEDHVRPSPVPELVNGVKNIPEAHVTTAKLTLPVLLLRFSYMAAPRSCHLSAAAGTAPPGCSCHLSAAAGTAPPGCCCHLSAAAGTAPPGCSCHLSAAAGTAPPGCSCCLQALCGRPSKT